MNTLSRALTARFFPSPDLYNALRKKWSDLINSEHRHELSAAHHLLYLALMGKDWRKAFTPLTNQRKLDNGAFWSWQMFGALHAIHSKYKEDDLVLQFDGLITPQMLEELRILLPVTSAYAHKPSDFANRTFPFDAYSEKKNEIIQIKKEEENG
jgi:hypothetical protein